VLSLLELLMRVSDNFPLF
jgi:hypothetical protein